MTPCLKYEPLRRLKAWCDVRSFWLDVLMWAIAGGTGIVLMWAGNWIAALWCVVVCLQQCSIHFQQRAVHHGDKAIEAADALIGMLQRDNDSLRRFADHAYTLAMKHLQEEGHEPENVRRPD